MASVGLGQLGTLLGGPIGGMIGSAIGGIIDAVIFAPKIPDGPRLDDRTVQGASYGDPIGRCYGTVRMGGCIIWAPELLERTVRVGKTWISSGQKTYEYDAHCAVAVVDGPATIVRIWANSKLIYDASGSGDPVTSKAKAIRFYPGSEDQMPDPLIQSYEGDTPAYRGTTYVVFERLALKDFGNSIPQFSFEVTAGGRSFDLALNTIVNLAGDDAYQSFAAPIRAGADTIQFTPSVVEIGGEYKQRFAARRFRRDASGVLALVDTSYTPVMGSGFLLAPRTIISPDGRYCGVYCDGGSWAVYDVNARAFLPFLGDSAWNTGLAWTGVDTLLTISNSEVSREYMCYAGGVIGIGARAGIGTSGALMVNQGTDIAFQIAYDGGQYKWGYRPTGSTGLGSLVTGSALPPEYIPGQPAGLHQVLKIADNLVLAVSRHAYQNIFYLQVLSTQAGIVQVAPTLELDYQDLTFGGYTTSFTYMGDGRVSMLSTGMDDIWYGEFSCGVNVCAVTREALSVPNPQDLPRPEIYSGATSCINGAVYATASNGMLVIVSAYAQSETVTLAHIMETEFKRAGMTAAQYDVTDLEQFSVWGMPVQQPSSARQIAEVLVLYKPFDLVESSGLIRAVARKSEVDLEVTNDWQIISGDNGSGTGWETDRTADGDLPKKLSVQYNDIDRDYEQSVQHATRSGTATTSTEETNVSMALCVSGQTALRVAEERLYTVVNERELIRFSAPREYIVLDPGDVVGFRDRPYRINRGTISGQHLDIEAVPLYLPAYNSEAIGSDIPQPRPPLLPTSTTMLNLLSIPGLTTEQSADAGFYLAAEPSITGSPWGYADILRSANGGSTWSQQYSTSDRAISGLATNALGSGPTDIFDRGRELTVYVRHGVLESIPEDDLLDSLTANLAIVGDEIIQFATATLTAPRTYKLTNMLRGRFGTDNKISGHVAGERFILLNEDSVAYIPVAYSEARTVYRWAGVTDGTDVDDAPKYDVALGMQPLVPYAPVHVKALRNVSTNDRVLTWDRQARGGTAWLDGADVPLDESVEKYEIDFIDSSSVVKRTVTVTAATTYTYTSAMVSADGTSGGTFKVYQISDRAGRGRAGEGNL